MTEVSNPLWGVFEAPIKDLSTKDFQWRKFIPQGTDLNLSSNIELRTQNVNEWIVPSLGYIRLQVQVCTVAGANTANVCVAGARLVNNAPLFSRGEYHVNNMLVESVENLHLVHLIRNYLEYSRDHALSVGPSQYFIPEVLYGGLTPQLYPNTTNGASDTVALRTFAETGGATHGNITDLATRIRVGLCNQTFAGTTTTSRLLTITIPLARLFGFCKDVHKVFIGVEHLIRFQKNSLVYATIAGATQTVYFNKVELWIPSISPSLTIQKSLYTQMLANAQIKAHYESSHCVSKVQVAGPPEISITLIKKRPTKAIFFIQQTTQLANDSTGNPVVFFHGNVTSCRLEINGKSYPELQYESSFSRVGGATTVAQYFESDTSRLYQEYLQCADKVLDYDGCPLFNQWEFTTHYPMYCFDLRYLEDSVFDQPSNVLRWITNATDGGVAGSDVVTGVIFCDSEVTISSVSNQIIVNA